MVEKLSLDETLLEENLAKARAELKKPRFRLYDKLIAKEPSNVPTEEISASTSAIERLLSIYNTVLQTFKTNGHLSANYATRDHFLNLYAIYAGAVEAQHHISRYTDGSEKTFVFRNKVDFSQGRFTILDDLVNVYLDSIQSVSGSTQVADYTNAFLTSLIQVIENESKIEEFSDLNEQAKQFFIQLDGVTINGFSYMLKAPEIGSFGKTNFSDIVGNEEMITPLKRFVDVLMHYDPRTKRNPYAERYGVTNTFLFWGGTGVGKTTTLRAVINYAVEQANKLGKPFFVRPVNSSDFKTEFYAQSANNIRKLRDEILKGEAIYLSYTDDIDTVFFSRDELEKRPEDKAVLGEIMATLDQLVEMAENYFGYVALTNMPVSGVDFAMARRLQENQSEVKGAHTPKQFAELFKIKLRQGLKVGYVRVKDWDRFGGMCVEYGFHGGDVKNISKSLISYANDFEMPVEVYSGISEEQKYKIIDSLIRHVDDSVVERTMMQYHEERERQKQSESRMAVESEKSRLRILNTAMEEYQNEEH